eukprot:COSAG02_NODE_57_length_43668_cov_118.217196_41_plen_90_part_00
MKQRKAPEGGNYQKTRAVENRTSAIGPPQIVSTAANGVLAPSASPPAPAARTSNKLFELESYIIPRQKMQGEKQCGCVPHLALTEPSPS